MEIQLFWKRLLDLIVAISLTITLLAILVFIACWIRIDSKGPIFFKQERLGKDGQVFQILKFRTMIPDAEQQGSGIVVKDGMDNRITRVGRILRASSLDELPQLWNVIVGEMSLVGPRPPVAYHPYDGYYNYPDWAKKRFDMAPGITGLAQVTIRNSAPWNERIKLDVQYVNTFSLALDFRILFQTAMLIIKPKNVY